MPGPLPRVGPGPLPPFQDPQPVVPAVGPQGSPGARHLPFRAWSSEQLTGVAHASEMPAQCCRAGGGERHTCRCTCAHACTHVGTHVCSGSHTCRRTRVHVSTHTHAGAHVLTLEDIQVHMCAHARIHVDGRVCSDLHTCRRTCVLKLTHVQAHTCAHACIHVGAHCAHTRTCVFTLDMQAHTCAMLTHAGAHV